MMPSRRISKGLLATASLAVSCRHGKRTSPFALGALAVGIEGEAGVADILEQHHPAVWHAVLICGVCGMHQEMGIDAEGDIVYVA